MVVFLVSSGKKQISPLLTPSRKKFGRTHWWPAWKNPSDTQVG